MRTIWIVTDAQVLTSVSLDLPPGSEPELLAGFRDLAVNGERPEGLVRSELLRSHGGHWVIQTLWRSREALLAARQTGAPPLALALAERVGAQHSHDVLTLEDAFNV